LGVRWLPRSLYLVACGCNPSLDLAPPLSAGSPSVTVEPIGTLEQAPPVLRLRVTGAFGRSDLADFRLFTGSLSTVHLGRLRQREVPKTLLAREVPRAAWGEGADVIVAPVVALEAGTLALASPELGLLAEVTVDPALAPWLARTWPPVERSTGRGTMIFCGAGAPAVEETEVLLEPALARATVRPGLGGDGLLERDCVRLEPGDGVPEGALLFPPPLVAGVALEPRPLVVASLRAPGTGCEAGELVLGPGCAVVEDDRVRIRARSAPSLWLLRAPEERLTALTPDRSLVVRGLEPERRSRLTGTVFDVDGSREEVDLEVLAASATAHVVINEVLADPMGAERTSEWIELVNDGGTSVQVGGFELRDATGVAILPEARLEPGEVALVVADGFAPDPELDLVAPGSVQRLVVRGLGAGGLANGGELLRLVDHGGRVLSRFPAIPAPGPGQSVARVAPDAPDDEPGSFAAHAEQGASPGWRNVVTP
jgi:hypothetical protein